MNYTFQPDERQPHTIWDAAAPGRVRKEARVHRTLHLHEVAARVGHTNGVLREVPLGLGLAEDEARLRVLQRDVVRVAKHDADVRVT